MADDFNPEAYLASKQKDQFDPEAYLRSKEPSYWDYAKDIGKQVLSAPVRIAEGAATWPAQVLNLAGQGVEALGVTGSPENVAEREKLRGLIAKQGGDKGVGQYLPKAETLPGKYAGTVADFAGGALTSPGRLAVTVPAAVTGAVTSEAAGQALESAGPIAEGAARIIGAIAGTGGVLGGVGLARHFTGQGTAEIAQKRLVSAFTRDGDTPDTALQRLAEIRQTRPDATLVDVAGPEVRGVLEMITQSPGPAKAITTPFLEAKQKGQMNRLVNDLTQDTGTRQTAFRAIEDTMATRRTAATPLYQQAYADGDRQIWSTELERLTAAPFVRSAMRKAVTTWQNQAVADGYGAMNPTMVDRGGLITFGQSVPAFPNIQFWDYTKRMLDDMTSSALRAGQNQKARTLTTLTQQLRADLDQQVPSYAGARNAWSGPSRYMEAIEDGRSILSKNMTAEELAATFQGMGEAEREAYRIGAVSTIRNTMGSNSAKLPDLTKIIRAPEMRAKLEVIMPSPAAAQRFNRALDYEIQSAATANQALTGSATARRLAAMEDANNLVGELAMAALPHKLGGTGLWSLIAGVPKKAQARLRRQSDAEIARTLTSPYPASALSQPPPQGYVPGAAIGTGLGLASTPLQGEDQNAQPNAQPRLRQAGGGVPAIGGTGGRSPASGASAGGGAARQGARQTLPDGGATQVHIRHGKYAEGGEVAPAEAKPPGFRERHAAMLTGTPASGPAFEKIQARKAPAGLTREDIRRTLQTFGISGEAAGAFSDRQLGERADVDSRAIGGSVDYETGERAPIHYDPGDETTFDARFGQWDQTSTGKSVPRDEEDVDSSVMMPGDKMIDRHGYQGERGKAGYYYTRGMADGGLTRGSEPDIAAAAAAMSDDPTINAMERMHQNRKIAQGQYDTQLSPDEEIKYRQWKAQNAPQDSGYDYDLRGAYRADMRRDPESGHMGDRFKKPNHPTFSDQSQYAPAAPQMAGHWEGETFIPPSDKLHQGLIPSTLLDETRKYLAEQIAGFEDPHEQQDPLEAAVKHSGAQKNPPSFGGSDEGRLPLTRADGGDVESDPYGDIFHSLQAMRDGGEVNFDWEDDKLPLPGQSRGLRSTAGPTVTSTTSEEDIPAPVTNRAGETMPTWLFKHWGSGLASKAQHLADLPRRSFEQAGELQATGESELDAPAEAAKHIVMGPAGMLARPGAGGTVLGAGAVRQAAPKGAELVPRRASPDEIARAAAGSAGMTQPQLRTLYGELGLTGLPPTELAAKSLARTQPPKMIEEATALKMADRERLNELTPDERKLFQQGKLNKPGFLLPSQEAAEPGLAAFKPVKKEITRAEKEFDRMPQQPAFFDISAKTLRQTPDVEQFPLPRVAPKMTERLEPAFQGGAGLRRIEHAAEQSQPSGWGWYNIQEALKSFVDILGPVRGPQAASAWLDSLAGTSMVNPISSNVRGSSYYLGNVMRGEPLPQVLHLKDPDTGKTIKTLAGPPPPGYGAKSQVQHADRVREYLQNAGDPVSNPKPMSYRQNLGGNYMPRTIDTHDIRNMVGMHLVPYKGKPTPYGKAAFGEEGALLPGEYSILEQLGARAAQRAGTPQAPQQAATWVGGGGYTGLKSEPIPLAEVLNRRIWVTSKVTGRTPEQVWTDHVTGRAPLMADGGVVAGLG